MRSLAPGDHLGSSSVITAGRAEGSIAEGQVIRQYGYKPFGNERYNSAPSAGENVPRRYTGQILDEETGLYYYNARYYDAEIGRFIQADTEFATGFPDSQSLNRYSYCANNPLVFTDPTGNFLGLPALLVAVITSAIISGSQAETANAGHFWDGAWKGAVNGLCTATLGPIAGGALGAALTGGDPGMAALSGCISVGLSFITGSLGDGMLDRLGGDHPSLLKPDQWARYGAEMALSAGTSALVGGIMAEIQGGNFAQGAANAAMWSAASYVMASVLNKDGDQQEEDTAWFKIKKFGLELLTGYEWNSSDVNAGLQAAGQGAKEGAIDGAKIAANSYSFGATDALGLTDSAALVRKHGVYGEISQVSAGISRDCALAAVGLKGATKINSTLNPQSVVSRWGRPGLQKKDWVMNGPVSKTKYFWSGKYQPGFGNQFARYSSGQNWTVSTRDLYLPANPIKALIGQRLYLP